MVRFILNSHTLRSIAPPSRRFSPRLLQRSTRQFVVMPVILLSGVFLLSATPAQIAAAKPDTQTHQTQDNSPQAQTLAARLPRSVVQGVRRDAAQRFNVPRRQFTIVTFDQQTWPDGCLGLATPEEICTMALVEGWRVELSDGQRNWMYRTDATGAVIRLEPDHLASPLPGEVTDRLLETIAKEHQLPIERLQVFEAQPATWDGCMGIYVPNQACNMIALSGYRVVVTDSDQSWVYHIDQDASRIVKNQTASGGRLVPSLMPIDAPQPDYDPELVFRQVETGSMTGMITEKYLRSDGTLYQRTWQPMSPRVVEPQIVKRLSPQDVAQFQQVLEEQRFPNLNRLRYISAASLADYPTTTLQAMGGTVDYTDLELDHLPRSLQAIIEAWQALD